ncbi:MAG: sulfurtransferase TusA family protein [Caulobacteraceae bacterium]
MSETIVDARGHRCPVPTLRLARALETSEPGAKLRLLADDPLARIDVPHFVAGKDCRLISCDQDGSTLAFVVQKGS